MRSSGDIQLCVEMKCIVKSLLKLVMAALEKPARGRAYYRPTTAKYTCFFSFFCCQSIWFIDCCLDVKRISSDITKMHLKQIADPNKLLMFSWVPCCDFSVHVLIPLKMSRKCLQKFHTLWESMMRSTDAVVEAHGSFTSINPKIQWVSNRQVMACKLLLDAEANQCCGNCWKLLIHFKYPYLWPRITRSMAGHPEALS